MAVVSHLRQLSVSLVSFPFVHVRMASRIFQRRQFLVSLPLPPGQLLACHVSFPLGQLLESVLIFIPLVQLLDCHTFFPVVQLLLCATSPLDSHTYLPLVQFLVSCCSPWGNFLDFLPLVKLSDCQFLPQARLSAADICPLGKLLIHSSSMVTKAPSSSVSDSGRTQLPPAPTHCPLRACSSASWDEGLGGWELGFALSSSVSDVV